MNHRFPAAGWVCLLALVSHSVSVSAQVPETMSIQGLLTNAAGEPVADGLHDVTFALYETLSGGAAVWTESRTVMTSNGIYNAILGEFNPLSVLSADAPLFLGIAVGSEPELLDRISVTSVPYALGLRGIKVIPTDPSQAPNIIAGHPRNGFAEAVHGATVSGGGFEGSPPEYAANRVEGHYGTVGGGMDNRAALRAAIGGGAGNRAAGLGSVVAGGEFNLALANHAVIGGGGPAQSDSGNVVREDYGTIAGGADNRIPEVNGLDVGFSAIGGGQANVARGPYATVAGGHGNLASNGSAVGGGRENRALGKRSVIGGGGWGDEWVATPDSGNAVYDDYGTIGGGVFNVAGTKDSNRKDGILTTIGGGGFNVASAYAAVVGGGYINKARGAYATISGGDNNRASAMRATVGGGTHNAARGIEAVVPGGWGNSASGRLSFAAGYLAAAKHQGTFVWSSAGDLVYGDSLKSTGPDQFLIRARGGVGIGTNDPRAQLHVSSAGNGATPQAEISQTTDDYARLRLRSGSASSHWDIAARTTADEEFNIFHTSRGNMLSISATGRLARLNGALLPSVNDQFSLGNGSVRWTALYATNGTIQTSDARLKDDIRPLSYGLEEVLRLEPVSFVWKDHPESGTRLGLIAQEIDPIIPEVVVHPERPEEALGARYGELIPVLIRAIQEQQAEIEALREEVAGLKAGR